MPPGMTGLVDADRPLMLRYFGAGRHAPEELIVGLPGRPARSRLLT
jgi:hypothetical protein